MIKYQSDEIMSRDLRKKQIKKVLVLGHHTPSFLSVIRSLGRGGVQVHIGWYRSDSIAVYSRYVYKAHKLPAYNTNNSEWKDALINIMKEEHFDLVVPCHDEMVFPIQRYKDELGKYGCLYVVNDISFDTLFDKIKTSELARKLGINLPSEEVVYDFNSMNEPLKRFDFPVVLKPQMSYHDADPPTRNKVQIVRSEEEYSSQMKGMLKYGPVAVQEYFRGRGVGVNFLMKDGTPLMVFQQSRVHEALRGGAGTYRKSTKVSPELLNASLKILSYLKYTGVAMVEFKVNEETGEWILVEVNARFWGSLPLALSAGADFPLALFQMLVDGRTTFKSDYRAGIYSRQFSSDIAWIIRNTRADRSDPTLLTVPLSKVMLEWIVNIITLRERVDTLTFDDPVPFFMELAQDLYRVIRKIGGSMKKKITNNYIMRRIHRNRIYKNSPGSRNILFVCYGNICRSPFAEQLAGKYLASVQNIESAGFFKESGRKPPDEAISAALKYGIDLSCHRSREITDDMINAADMIFVFDYMNYRAIARQYKSARRRTYFIGSLLSKQHFFLDDPWGGPESLFDNAYRNINQALLVLKDWVETK